MSGHSLAKKMQDNIPSSCILGALCIRKKSCLFSLWIWTQLCSCYPVFVFTKTGGLFTLWVWTQLCSCYPVFVFTKTGSLFTLWIWTQLCSCYPVFVFTKTGGLFTLWVSHAFWFKDFVEFFCGEEAESYACIFQGNVFVESLVCRFCRILISDVRVERCYEHQ